MATIAPTTLTGATTPTGSVANSATAATVDYNQFLTLLIAQLKNQDPTKPADSTQFVSQLASFSAVEQQISTNSKLDQMITSSNLSQASSLIGLHVKSADGTVEGNVAQVSILSSGATAILDNGKAMPIGAGVTFSLPSAAPTTAPSTSSA